MSLIRSAFEERASRELRGQAYGFQGLDHDLAHLSINIRPIRLISPMSDATYGRNGTYVIGRLGGWANS